MTGISECGSSSKSDRFFSRRLRTPAEARFVPRARIRCFFWPGNSTLLGPAILHPLLSEIHAWLDASGGQFTTSTAQPPQLRVNLQAREDNEYAPL